MSNRPILRGADTGSTSDHAPASDFHLMPTNSGQQPRVQNMSMSASSTSNLNAGIANTFTRTVGELPFMQPNARKGHEEEDLHRMINTEQKAQTPPALKCFLSTLCCMTGFGACYLCAKQTLVKDGMYAFSRHNQHVQILTPGRHILASPFNNMVAQFSSGDDVISVSPISIIRVQDGQLGFAFDNGQPQILLPGVHVRKSAAFKFQYMRDVTDTLIQFGPVKLLTVKSGGSRVCYSEGQVQIFEEGRYGINSSTFEVAGHINTKQQNLRFSRHTVLLDGGISMLVEGLLTYQVTDVAKLINNLGDSELLRSLQDVTKAELARAFSSVHLEQIASQQTEGDVDDQQASGSLLGGDKSKKAEPGQAAKTVRNVICDQVVESITPLFAAWGVAALNFQLESTKIEDAGYAAQYEEASLKMAKAKADRRALQMENDIKLQKATALARAVQIEAEGAKNATIIRAEGQAQARKIEAESRNTAAQTMSDPWAQKFALQQQQVEFAAALKANVLTVIPDSGIGSALASQAMFNDQAQKANFGGNSASK